MTEQQIMSITHDDLVQLFVLRREDLKAAGKEATRITRNERHKKNPEYQARQAGYNRIWNQANKEYRKEYLRRWNAENREKVNEYARNRRRKRALEKQSAVTAAVAVTVGPPAIIPQVSETPKVVIPRVKVVVSKMSEPDEPKRRTNKGTVEYWQSVIDDLEYRFFAKEIDVEAYFSGRNAAMSHLLAAEERMKPKRVRNY